MRKTIFFILYFTLLYTSNWVGAQCDQIGQVVQPSNGSNCGKLILSYTTWDLLVPTNADMLNGVEVNDEIFFSYLVDTLQLPSCNVGPAVLLNCVNAVGPPAQDCSAEFGFADNFNKTAPTVSFQPTTIVTADYFWDFGDGTSSSGHTVTHIFPAQGFYDVCLTVSGGICSTNAVLCQTIDLHECHAEFYHESENGMVNFTNLSSGNYTGWEWTLGNGYALQNADPGSYDYGAISIYTVCLTVWNNNGCTSKFCDYVYSGPGDICEFAACVYPGDTNTDGAANVYDLLPIGVGYGTQGPPRQLDDVAFALDWSAQYAPDWGQETVNGNDFKHLDCNGDGKIDAEDAIGIEANYAAPGNVFMVQSPGSPTFWLDFEWDTILIDDNTPALITLEADLMAGTSDHPMENLNGFAMQLHYPEDMVVLDGITADYNDNSFFGSSNSILWIHKDRHLDGGEFDLGFTRKHDDKNGFGKIATLNFIIIGDVIARGADASFTVTLKDVVAVNKEGAMLTIGELEPAVVHVVNKTTTNVHEDWINEQVIVFPNPAKNNIHVQTGSLEAESVTLFNSLGQMVFEMSTKASAFHLSVMNWEPGIYLVKIKTNKGVANKRVVVGQ